MTLSYNIGLTGGSIAAYFLDSLLGPPPNRSLCDVIPPILTTPWPKSNSPIHLPVPQTPLTSTTLKTTSTVATLVLNVTTEALNSTTTIIPTLVTSVINSTSSTLGLV